MLSTCSVPSACSVTPIDARLTVEPLLLTPPATTDASALRIVFSVESPSSGPCDDAPAVKLDSEPIVVTSVL